MPLLTQETTAAFLRRVTAAEEVGEILGVYAYGKQLKGRNTAQIHRSLHLLALYLNSVGLADLVRENQHHFNCIRSFAASPGGISKLLYLGTRLGIEAWNEARRTPGRGSLGLRRSASTDSLESLRSSRSARSSSDLGLEGSGTGSGLAEEAEREIREAFWNAKPVPYTAEPPDYVERDSPEGRRRVIGGDEEEVPLPLYARDD